MERTNGSDACTTEPLEPPSEVELLTLDGNGRFLIPKRYQRMADIEQDIKFVGMGDTIEIWSSKKADEQQMKPEEFEAALEDLMADEE